MLNITKNQTIHENQTVRSKTIYEYSAAHIKYVAVAPTFVGISPLHYFLLIYHQPILSLLPLCQCTIPNVGKPQFGFWEEEEEKRENTENWGQTCPVITKLYQHTHTLIGAWGVD